MKIFELFSTRELATGFYLLVICIALLIVPSIRKAFGNFLKAAFSPILIRLTILYCALGTVITILFSKLPCWKVAYLKDIIMWILFVGVPFCFGATKRHKQEGYYKNIVFDNLKYTVIFECFFATFTFSLLGEIILLPIVTVIALLEREARREPKFHPVAKVCRGVLFLIGTLLIIFTIKKAVEQITLETSYDMLASVLIPLIYSVIYAPFGYLLDLRIQYRMAFMRIGFVKDERWIIQKWHCIKLVISCGFSIKKLEIFTHNLVNSRYRKLTEKEFNTLLPSFSNHKDSAPHI